MSKAIAKVAIYTYTITYFTPDLGCKSSFFVKKMSASQKKEAKKRVCQKKVLLLCVQSQKELINRKDK